jgi:hypothetical protein
MMNRYQRSRQRGARLPPNTRCVDRSTRYGNPFKIGPTMVVNGTTTMRVNRRLAIWLYETWAEAAIREGTLDLLPLVGKHLACYCPLCRKHRDNGKPLAIECPDCTPCHIDAIGRLLASPAMRMLMQAGRVIERRKNDKSPRTRR